MDGLQPILLIAVLYFAAKVWNYFVSRQPANAPNLPKQVCLPEIETGAQEWAVEAFYAKEAKVLPIPHHQNSNLPSVEECGAWEGQLTDSLLVNGVIFAEILQPPRAYRPFRREFK